MRFFFFLPCSSVDQVIASSKGNQVPDFSMLNPGYEPDSPLYHGYHHDYKSNDNDSDSEISDLTDHSDGYGERDSTLEFIDDDLTALSSESTDVICLTRQPSL